MMYLTQKESDARVLQVKNILSESDVDVALIYYDEFNIGNGWYLTGWCPQFESGAVLVPKTGSPMILGGPESEPFAKLDSAIKDTRNFPVFMVPDEEYPNAIIIDFHTLFAELNALLGTVKRVGLVGGDRMPFGCYRQLAEGFSGVELVDITPAYTALRYTKSSWEREQIRAAFRLADQSYHAMKEQIKAGVSEINIAAAGEHAARSRGASGFGFSTIVGSGTRSNAVVPTASIKPIVGGELVMVGISPKVNGYAGVVGDVIAADGNYTDRQKSCIQHLKQAFRLTKAQLVVGKTGREIDAPARAFFDQLELSPYLVCPFVHTIGLHEAESPFFGPQSNDVLQPGMMVCIDISFFGHPEFHGVRIETGYEITADGPVPLSPMMDALFLND
ncbi:Xaa-Pro peptidase family protein [Parapedobacter sp. 10938]|uniref:Xaa-Pro peptidase family protein n=1 Tax=Parapedobacter flavus TaxID=3110225 RepID=UPI002DBD04AD|nr:Xaa-Pro peptidase family protein [Parapedobacter sp. 10938]MEC3879524.1 Xaa-Pro peptidase family protein [Parapedobacter sp. 10938]